MIQRIFGQLWSDLLRTVPTVAIVGGVRGAEVYKVQALTRAGERVGVRQGEWELREEEGCASTSLCAMRRGVGQMFCATVPWGGSGFQSNGLIIPDRGSH